MAKSEDEGGLQQNVRFRLTEWPIVQPRWLSLSPETGPSTPPFGIDLLATLVTLYAQRFCRHGWHQFLVWLALTLTALPMALLLGP